MRRIAMLEMVVLQACAAHGVHPLKPLDLATAQYQGFVTQSLTGSLFYDGNCLLFRDDQRTAPLLPVWPSGSVFNGTSVIFEEPGRAEQPIVMGEEVRLDGRLLDWAAMSHPTYTPYQRRCGAQPFLVSHVKPAN